MRNTARRLIFPALILCMCLSALASQTDRNGIVAGSTLIADIVSDLTEGSVPVRTLVPPGMCPGHFDVRPSDVRMLAECRALLVHPWQMEMTGVQNLLKAAAIPEKRVKVIAVADNWMAPPTQAEATKAVTEALAAMAPEEAARYRTNAAQRIEMINRVEREMRVRLNALRPVAVRVLCNEMQKEFVEWAGFELSGVFSRPESMSVAEVERLIGDAERAGVSLVIDNLQSGAPDASKTIAEGLKAERVVLSNFPGGFADTDTWADALERNVELLAETLEGLDRNDE